MAAPAQDMTQEEEVERILAEIAAMPEVPVAAHAAAIEAASNMAARAEVMAEELLAGVTFETLLSEARGDIVSMNMRAAELLERERKLKQEAALARARVVELEKAAAEVERTYFLVRVTVIANQRAIRHTFAPKCVAIPSNNPFALELAEDSKLKPVSLQQCRASFNDPSAPAIHFDFDVRPQELINEPVLFGSLMQALDPGVLNKRQAVVLAKFLHFIGEAQLPASIDPPEESTRRRVHVPWPERFDMAAHLERLARIFLPCTARSAQMERRICAQQDGHVLLSSYKAREICKLFIAEGLAGTLPRDLVLRCGDLLWNVQRVLNIYLQKADVETLRDRLTPHEYAFVEYMSVRLQLTSFETPDFWFRFYWELVHFGSMVMSHALAKVWASTFTGPYYAQFYNAIAIEQMKIHLQRCAKKMTGCNGNEGLVAWEAKPEWRVFALDMARRLRAVMKVWLGRNPTLDDWNSRMWCGTLELNSFDPQLCELVDMQHPSEEFRSLPHTWERMLFRLHDWIRVFEAHLMSTILFTALSDREELTNDTLQTRPPFLSHRCHELFLLQEGPLLFYARDVPRVEPDLA